MVLLKPKAKISVDTGCVTRLTVRCMGSQINVGRQYMPKQHTNNHDSDGTYSCLLPIP